MRFKPGHISAGNLLTNRHYKVFAWEKIETDAYTSPDFLQPYENLGETVHITEGSRNTVQVNVIPFSDADP